MTAEEVAAVLAEHADCVMNSPQDIGAAVTGRDVWTCGISLPFEERLEDAERAHVAAAVTAALGAGEGSEAAGLRAVLHDVWLAIHVRRFDVDSPHDGRNAEAIDTFYRGIQVAELLVSRIARAHGIERVYDSIPGHETDHALIDGTPETEASAPLAARAGGDETSGGDAG